jgi:hypothetical protein
MAGAANTRYPIPPTSITTESAETAPIFPSTEAIIRERSRQMTPGATFAMTTMRVSASRRGPLAPHG